MLARGGGHLLHTASAAGLLTNIGAAAYAVTKHAVVALAEWLAVTYGDRGIDGLLPVPAVRGHPDARRVRRRRRDAPVGRRAGGLPPSRWPTPWSTACSTGRFLILPHPEVAGYYATRASDPDRWLAGMRRLQASLGYEPPPLA